MEAQLFDKVRCKGFYKSYRDGLYIALDKRNLTADLMNSHLATAYNSGLVESEVEQVEKTYYQHKDMNFAGVIVGFIDLKVVGYLEVMYEDAVDVGVGIIPEKYYVAKLPKEVVRCAIVYYANNRKHYVPLEDIVETIG